MNKAVRVLILLVAIAGVVFLSACSPKVGSEAWCTDMQSKPKGDWTANDAADFAKHCVLK